MCKKYFISLALALLGATSLYSPAAACPTVNSVVAARCNLSGGQTLLVTNSGAITVTTGHAAVANGIAIVSATNNGTLNGADAGLSVRGGGSVSGAITNNANALMIGTLYGLDIRNVTINNGVMNAGRLDSPTGYALSVQTSANISGGITNAATGRIEGQTAGVYIRNSVLNGGLVNRNVIEGRAGPGVHLVASGTVNGGLTNHDNASITGTTHGLYIYTASLNGGLNNAGTIEGTTRYGIWLENNAHIRGVLLNDATGQIKGVDAGLRVQGSNVHDGIINRHLIEGATGIGIHVLATGEINNGLTNAANARISGRNDGLYLNASSLNGGLNNAGTIEGAARHGLWLENSAHIRGGLLNEAGGVIKGAHTALLIEASNVDGGIVNRGVIEGGAYALRIRNPLQSIVMANYGTMRGDVFIQSSTLDLNDGSMVAGRIGGQNGIININTNFATGADYGLDGDFNGDNAGLAQINIAAGKTMQALAANRFRAADVHNSGVLAVGRNTVTIDGAYRQDAAAALHIQAASTIEHGKLAITGQADFAPNTGIVIDVTGGVDFVNGDASLRDVILAGTLNEAGFTVSDNSALFNFQAVRRGNAVDLLTLVDLGQSAARSVMVVGNPAAREAAAVLDTLILNPAGGDMNTVINAFGTLSSSAAISSAISQTLPVLTGASATATLNNMTTVNNIIRTRQETASGFGAGNQDEAPAYGSGRIWVKPFGTKGRQENDGNITGFRSDSAGLIAGADFDVDDRRRVGGALAYTRSDIRSHDKGNRLDVDSYQAIAYAHHRADSGYEIFLQADAGLNRNESERDINFGGLQRTARADYNSYSGHVGVGAERTYPLGADTGISPSVKLDYNVISNENYRESGADALDLKVGSQTVHQLVPAAAAKLRHGLDGNWTINARAGIGYDVIGDENAVTSTYVGGGGAFVTTAIKPSRWIVESGVGLEYTPDGRHEIDVRYEREDRGQDNDTQSLSVRFTRQF